MSQVFLPIWIMYFKKWLIILLRKKIKSFFKTDFQPFTTKFHKVVRYISSPLFSTDFHISSYLDILSFFFVKMTSSPWKGIKNVNRGSILLLFFLSYSEDLARSSRCCHLWLVLAVHRLDFFLSSDAKRTSAFKNDSFSKATSFFYYGASYELILFWTLLQKSAETAVLGSNCRNCIESLIKRLELKLNSIQYSLFVVEYGIFVEGADYSSILSNSTNLIIEKSK